MRQLVVLLFVVGTVLGAGCEAPRAGDKCNTTGFFCSDATMALECRAGVWLTLPCKGPGGCARDGDVIRCDMSGNGAGDACASTAEAKGLCAQDGKSTLECRGGLLVKTNVCSSCVVEGDHLRCTP